MGVHSALANKLVLGLLQGGHLRGELGDWERLQQVTAACGMHSREAGGGACTLRGGAGRGEDLRVRCCGPLACSRSAAAAGPASCH